MEKEISKLQLLVLTASAGICVANIYYSQPIIIDIARDFKVKEDVAGQMPFFSQIGYGLGLFLLAPLGDKVERKKLIVVLQGLLVVTLLMMLFVKQIEVLLLLNFLIGIFAVATQVIMPFAASLAGANKGQVVGTVFTGALVGILGARVFSGFLTHLWGWQLVFIISALLLLVTSSAMWFILPSQRGGYTGSYSSLVLSSVRQIREFPLLRKCAALSFLVFGAFSSFWTTLTFHLSGAYHYNSNQIGLFGILGIGGALVAPAVGKLADRGSPGKIQFYTVGLTILSILLMWCFSASIWAIIIGVILLDIGVQSTVVVNIAQIYSLDESAHSRINTIYMTLTFIGGAIGTRAGLFAWETAGWNGAATQMTIWLIVALFTLLIFNKKLTVKKNANL